jgi:hypothetical protein
MLDEFIVKRIQHLLYIPLVSLHNPSHSSPLPASWVWGLLNQMSKYVEAQMAGAGIKAGTLLVQ